MAQNTNKWLNIFLVFTVSFKTTNFNFSLYKMQFGLSKDNIEYYYPFLFGDENTNNCEAQADNTLYVDDWKCISWRHILEWLHCVQVVTINSISRSMKKKFQFLLFQKDTKRMYKKQKALVSLTESSYN